MVSVQGCSRIRRAFLSNDSIEGEVLSLDIVNALNYRELQAALKARGVKATGSTNVLRQRLADWVGDLEHAEHAPHDAMLTSDSQQPDDEDFLPADNAVSIWDALGMNDLFGDEEERAGVFIDNEEDDMVAIDDEETDEALLLKSVFGTTLTKDESQTRDELARVAESSSSIEDVMAAWANVCDLPQSPSEADSLAVLRACARLGAFEAAAQVVKDVELQRAALSCEEWKLVFRAHAIGRNSAKADALAAAARKRGTFPESPDGALFRAMLKACVGAQSWRRAVAIVREMHAREDVYVGTDDWELVFFAIQRNCVDSGREGTDRFKKRARFALKSGLEEERLQLLQELEREPAVAVPAGDASAALVLLREMEEVYGCAPSIRAFDAAASAISHAARPELALELLKTILERFSGPAHDHDDDAVELRRRAYTNALGALKRAAFFLMEAAPLDKPVTRFVVARRKQLALAAQRVVAKMFESPLDAADERVVEEALVVACATCSRCFDADAAASLLDAANRRAAIVGGGAWPSIKVYNALLSAYEASGRSVDASRLLAEMDARQFDSTTFNICLKVCAKNGDFERAETVLDEMAKSERVAPDVYSYTTAVRACCFNGRRRREPRPGRRPAHALRILEKALRNGCANHVTLRTAVRACVGAPSDPEPAYFDAEHALAVVNVAVKYGVAIPNFDEVTALRLRAAARRGPSRRGPLSSTDFSDAARELDRLLVTKSNRIVERPNWRPPSRRSGQRRPTDRRTQGLVNRGQNFEHLNRGQRSDRLNRGHRTDRFPPDDAGASLITFGRVGQHNPDRTSDLQTTLSIDEPVKSYDRTGVDLRRGDSAERQGVDVTTSFTDDDSSKRQSSL